jgi:hypothetical protein
VKEYDITITREKLAYSTVTREGAYPMSTEQEKGLNKGGAREGEMAERGSPVGSSQNPRYLTNMPRTHMYTSVPRNK